jgi:hypothetical protein
VNFGPYATPEGTSIFDVNDFEETLPAPFEWDVKRLAASLAVAGRVAGASGREAWQLARTAAKSYRRHLGQLAPCPRSKPGAHASISPAPLAISTLQRSDATRHATVLRGAAQHYGLVERENSDWKIRDKPPPVYHLSGHELHAHQAFVSYAETLQEDRRVLVQRYYRRDARPPGSAASAHFAPWGSSCRATVRPCCCRKRGAAISV